MACLEKFRQLVDKYNQTAEFAIVYIEESHPKDGWKIPGNLFQISTPRTLEDRLEAARQMVEKEPLSCPVVVDSLSNAVGKAYAAMPERLYIIQDGLVMYQGGLGSFGYELHKVDEWLEKYSKEN